MTMGAEDERAGPRVPSPGLSLVPLVTVVTVALLDHQRAHRERLANYALGQADKLNVAAAGFEARAQVATDDERRKRLVEEIESVRADPVLKAAAASSKPNKSLPVPQSGETILWFICSPDRLEVVLGDLERNFDRRAAARGASAARRWYWWQVVRTSVMFLGQIIGGVALLRGLLQRLGIWTG